MQGIKICFINSPVEGEGWAVPPVTCAARRSAARPRRISTGGAPLGRALGSWAGGQLHIAGVSAWL